MIKYLRNSEIFSIIGSILMIILSLLLITAPDKFTTLISVIFGITLIIEGICSITNYFTTSKKNRSIMETINGVITIVLGVLLIIYSEVFISLTAIILGLWMIVNNLDKMLISFYLRNEKNNFWLIAFIISIIMIILGLVLVINPFNTILKITTICGIIILISELINLIISIYLLIKLR